MENTTQKGLWKEAWKTSTFKIGLPRKRRSKDKEWRGGGELGMFRVIESNRIQGESRFELWRGERATIQGTNIL